MPYELVFDEVILDQLRSLRKNVGLRHRVSKMLDSIERLGPRAGNCLDVRGLYEVKSIHPSIRLYFRHYDDSAEIFVFEYEMKTSVESQKRTIYRLRFRIRGQHG